MRFKTDENLPEESAAILREAGHDAHTIREQALGGHPDGDVATVCKRELRDRSNGEVAGGGVLEVVLDRLFDGRDIRLDHAKRELVEDIRYALAWVANVIRSVAQSSRT